jgi:hypothetical protein
VNNDALFAALGVDAGAAVNGYRLDVISEAERRGLRLVSEAHPDVVQVFAEIGNADPIDIRLTFLHCPGRPELAGRTLRWGPAHGWSLSHRAANAPLSYYAGPGASPLLLVPTAPEIVEWAIGACDGPATAPAGIELEDDPEAIRRLLSFIHPQRRLRASEAFQLAARARSQGVHQRVHRSAAGDVEAGIKKARKS